MRIEKLLELLVRHLPQIHLGSRLRQIFVHVINRQIVHPVDLQVLCPVFSFQIPKIRHIARTHQYQQKGNPHDEIASPRGGFPLRRQDDADDNGNQQQPQPNRPCLLYTSDAADD